MEWRKIRERTETTNVLVEKIEKERKIEKKDQTRRFSSALIPRKLRRRWML